MKKFLSLVLSVVVTLTACLTFASCGKDGNVYAGLTVLPTDIFATEDYGVAFRKGSDLAGRLDAMFAADFADGTAARVAATYGVDGSLVTEFTARAAGEVTDRDYNAIRAKGKLVVGVTYFDGMDYQDAEGNWIGFDADMAKRFAASLGVTAEFVVIDWEKKLIDLNAGNIDCIWNGMTVTDAILNACEVSGTYMVNGQVLVIKEGAYKSLSELAGKVIAVEGGSAGYYQATENLGNCEIKEVTAQVNALLEVKAGTADACVVDYVLAKSLLDID